MDSLDYQGLLDLLSNKKILFGLLFGLFLVILAFACLFLFCKKMNWQEILTCIVIWVIVALSLDWSEGPIWLMPLVIIPCVKLIFIELRRGRKKWDPSWQRSCVALSMPGFLAIIQQEFELSASFISIFFLMSALALLYGRLPKEKRDLFIKEKKDFFIKKLFIKEKKDLFLTFIRKNISLGVSQGIQLSVIGILRMFFYAPFVYILYLTFELSRNELFAIIS